MRFRTLEAILATIITLAVCAMPKKASAQDIFVVIGDSDKITKTTIAENYSAWNDGGNIIVSDLRMDANDPNAQYVVNDSGEANSPNLDMQNLVYEQAGSLWWHDLDTKEKLCIFPASSYGECRHPKINGTNIVYRFDTLNAQEIWGADVSKGMDIRNIRYFPITNSKNPKGPPDIYNCLVVWPELVNKPDSEFDVYDLLSYGERKYWFGFVEQLEAATEPNELLNGEDWDIYAYDLATGEGFIINNEPNHSTDSVAIWGNKVLYSWNTCIDGPTGITFYYPSIDRYRKSLPGPRGSIHNVHLHKNRAAWVRKWARHHYKEPESMKDRIEQMNVLPIGVKSEGERAHDEGGHQFGPDAFEKLDGEASISYATTDSNLPSAHSSSIGSSSITEPYSSASSATSAAVTTTFRNVLWRDLKLIFDNWLKRKAKGALYCPKGDFNVDEVVDFRDIAVRLKAEEDLLNNVD